MTEESYPQSDLPNEDAAPRFGPVPESGIAPEVSRRVSAILDAVEREAASLREDAREESRRYLDYSQRRADALVAERQRRIAELSDEIIAKAEAVVGRLEDAAPVRQGFDNLVRALGDAAERLAREAERTRPEFEPPAFHDEALQQQPGQPPPEPPPAWGEQHAPSSRAPGAPPAGTDGEPAYHEPPATYEPSPGAPPPEAPAEAIPPPHPARAPYPQPDPPAPTAAPGRPPAPEQELDQAKLVAIQMAAAGRTRAEVRDHLQGAIGLIDTRGLLDEVFGAGTAEDARVPWSSLPR